MTYAPISRIPAKRLNTAGSAFGFDFTPAAGDSTVYDLRELKVRKGDGGRGKGVGSRLYVCLNTAHSINHGGAVAWLNVLQPHGTYRREYETRRFKGQMIRACADARDLAERVAVDIARRGGYQFVVVTHET
jgi:hypothetical protein